MRELADEGSHGAHRLPLTDLTVAVAAQASGLDCTTIITSSVLASRWAGRSRRRRPLARRIASVRGSEHQAGVATDERREDDVRVSDDCGRQRNRRAPHARPRPSPSAPRRFARTGAGIPRGEPRPAAGCIPRKEEPSRGAFARHSSGPGVARDGGAWSLVAQGAVACCVCLQFMSGSAGNCRPKRSTRPGTLAGSISSA